MSTRNRGQRGERPHLDGERGRREAEEGLGQAPQVLHILRLRTGRRGPGIGQHMVDLGHAGTGAIAQPGHLERRGPPREQRQAVVGGVAGEVDQDVDAVGVHARRRGRVVDAVDTMPGLATGADAPAQVIFCARIRIHDEFDPALRLRGQCRQHPLRKITDRVLAQVARHQAHAQGAAAAVGPGLVGARPGRRQRAECTRFVQQIGIAAPVHVVLHEEQVAAHREIVRGRREHEAELVERFVEAA